LAAGSLLDCVGVRILALDFDGVISDSAPECFTVALQAYVALRPASRLVVALESLERALSAGQLDRGFLDAQPLYGRFLSVMPLGNRAEDFAVGLHALEMEAALDDQDAYDRHKAELPESFLADFHARFYEERRAFAERDPAGWLQLLAPYPSFVELLRRRGGDVTLALATAKDRPSVVRLLASYGIADLFPAELVLDKEVGVSKRAHLGVLRERLNAPFADITFVDDKVNHLEDVSPLGVRPVLAAWGYNSRREHERARELGYAMCTLESAEAVLFDT
jgi:phosphoglycolate phosphatase-like HAD superfamily hydrolase